MPAYLPSLINQHSPVHYIEASESYGLPADVCPLPSLEAGIAIEDDFPKVGCCFISCNMPCDGSIMTTTMQDRRFNLPTFPLNSAAVDPGGHPGICGGGNEGMHRLHRGADRREM